MNSPFQRGHWDTHDGGVRDRFGMKLVLHSNRMHRVLSWTCVRALSNSIHNQHNSTQLRAMDKRIDITYLNVAFLNPAHR